MEKDMLQYCVDKWERNKEKLKRAIEEDCTINNSGYDYLVKLIVRYILNDGECRKGEKWEWLDADRWDEERITMIDDGQYQGTLLFLIPQVTMSPFHWQYLQTYVEYGSCSLCDTLEGIQENDKEYTQSLDKLMKDTEMSYAEACKGLKPSKTQVEDYMTLCRNLICHMERPFYNPQWTVGDDFESEYDLDNIVFVAEEIETGKKLEFTLLDLYGFDDESVNIWAYPTVKEFSTELIIKPSHDRIPELNNRLKVRLKRVDEDQANYERIIKISYAEMLPEYRAKIIFNNGVTYNLNMENMAFLDKKCKSIKMSEMFTEEEFMKATYTPRYIEWRNGRKKSVEDLYYHLNLYAIDENGKEVLITNGNNLED